MLLRERRAYEQTVREDYRHRRRRKIGNAIESVSLIFSIYVVAKVLRTSASFKSLEETQGFLTFHRPPTHNSVRENEGVSYIRVLLKSVNKLAAKIMKFAIQLVTMSIKCTKFVIIIIILIYNYNYN